MPTSHVSYIHNGCFGYYAPQRSAVLPINDRATLFSDAVYEVIALQSGQLIDGPEHFERLKYSLEGLAIRPPVSINTLYILIKEVVRRNQATHDNIYIQISRGVAPRNHLFPPENVRPTLVISLLGVRTPHENDYKAGISVITAPDERWGRRNLKTVSLLPNILAKQAAKDVGAKECWLYDTKRSVFTEGSSTNAFIVTKKNILQTHPANEHILGGITRAVILRLAAENSLDFCEEPFGKSELSEAKEAFITSTTLGIMPVTSIDNSPVDQGDVGPITTALMVAYRSHLETYCKANHA